MLHKLILLSLTAVALPAAGILPYPYVQEDLPNGLRVVTITTDYPNIVALHVVVATGSRNEVEAGKTGFAHLFEHMMFRGTEKVPPAKYREALARAGAASNASTSDDLTNYHTVIAREDLEQMLMLEADRFQHLQYPPEILKTESLAVLGEYNKNSANPVSKLDEALRSAAFSRHTYRHTTMGFLKDVQDMPQQFDYSRQFFDRYYRPEYTTIVVVGEVEPKAVRRMVEKYWGGWRHGTYRAEIPAEPVQDAPRTAHVDWPAPTLPWITVAYKSPAYTDTEKNTAALAALAYLAFSPTSDLYQKLVVQEQKVDSLSAMNSNHVDPYLFEITARLKKPADLDYVREQVMAAVKQYREELVPAERLDAVKKHLRYGFSQSMDSNASIAAVVSRYVALRRTPETINRLYVLYAQLTPEDVRHAASTYLTENGRTIVTLTGAAAGQGGAR
jgi:zinc protease